MKQFKETKQQIIETLDLIEKMLERSNSRTVEQTALRCINDIDRISNSAFLNVAEMQSAKEWVDGVWSEDSQRVLTGDTIIYEGHEWTYSCYGGEDYFMRWCDVSECDVFLSVEKANGKCRIKEDLS